MIDMTVPSIRPYNDSVVWLGREGEVIGVAGCNLACGRAERDPYVVNM
jgi:hypothetical protein